VSKTAPSRENRMLPRMGYDRGHDFEMLGVYIKEVTSRKWPEKLCASLVVPLDSIG
jgi:hypothetical protein